MIAKTFVVLAALASAVLAAPAPPASGRIVRRCNRPSSASSTVAAADPTPTLPLSGTTPELAAPSAGLVLKRIAVGHGIQNYTCDAANGTAIATGALAVLYDITDLYPGTPNTGLSAADFNGLPKQILYGQNIPLNLQDKAAAAPTTQTTSNVLPEASYGAVVDDSYLPPANSSLGSIALPYLGVHFFDYLSRPTFDLRSSAGLYGSTEKVDAENAPASADHGLLGTGAVAWLRLVANDDGLSVGIGEVYRVNTAGGSPQSCSVSGAGSGSVPYAAQYWFYGTA